MTIAAVTAAAVTFKICFFMGRPHVVSEFSIICLGALIRNRRFLAALFFMTLLHLHRSILWFLLSGIDEGRLSLVNAPPLERSLLNLDRTSHFMRSLFYRCAVSVFCSSLNNCLSG